jgi:hypothetical protein
MRRFLLAAGLALIALAPLLAAATRSATPTFTDAVKQSAEFLDYNRTIRLTPEQEAVKKAALEAIPAPCCSDNSAYTCCCPCNLAKTIWGLSHYLIAKQNYDVAATRSAVEEWVRFVSPQGHSGKTCYQGGCPKPFAKSGCGGMAEPTVF